MRITIAEILTLFVAFAALLAASQQPRHGEFVWLRSALAYAPPTVPLAFDDNDRDPPYSIHAGILIDVNMDDWKDGPSYFQLMYRRGWERCRYHFVSSESIEPQSPPDLSTLPSDSWEHHAEFAFASGYNTCAQQIAELLHRYPKPKLINRICYPKHLIEAPLIVIFLMAIGTFSAMRYRRRSISESIADRTR